ncbi:Leucine-rich repeat-containing protein 51 [Borealophlyctis nickersoniae]|nr:Leucine-rich repeat-containing protein 51 [Borealophlyctis nickersoniae]
MPTAISKSNSTQRPETTTKRSKSFSQPPPLPVAPPKTTHHIVLDYGFKELASLEDIQTDDTPRPPPTRTHPPPHVSIRLNNNTLTTLPRASVVDVVKGWMRVEFEWVGWLDFSFNGLTAIDEALLMFPNLTTLYLHANNITLLSDVDVLAGLPGLRNLTLHGNPVEQAKGYRHHVIARLPRLRRLDFAGVTKMERSVAKVLEERGKKRGQTGEGVDGGGA